MNFLIILMVGLLEGMIARPLVLGNGWGEKLDITIAIAGALIASLIYSSLGFPMKSDWAPIFTSMVGATLFLLQALFIANDNSAQKTRSTFR